MPDTPIPLCTAAQFTSGPYADLASQYAGGTLDDLMIEATRLCEGEVQRRLAPFTTLETHRASAMDPDEYSDGANMPLPIQGTLGQSYAASLGANSLVRHVWLNQYPKFYPEMWEYSDVTVQVILSYGGTPRTLGPAQILDGPDETGHIWFTMGQFIPIGSRLRVTYSGGFTVATPADLVRANKFMAAYLAMRDLNPDDATHDPDQLHVDAMMILAAWQRDD